MRDMAILILFLIVFLLLSAYALRLVPKRPPGKKTLAHLFINILLVLGVLGVLSKAWSLLVVLGHLKSSLLVSPSGNVALDALSTAAYAVALYGIWRRRKWGAYLIFPRLAFTILVQIFIYRSLSWQLLANYSGLENVAADAIGGITWLIAFILTWSEFT